VVREMKIARSAQTRLILQGKEQVAIPRANERQGKGRQGGRSPAGRGTLLCSAAFSGSPAPFTRDWRSFSFCHFWQLRQLSSPPFHSRLRLTPGLVIPPFRAS
jgi:hypothetical protein